MEPPRRIRVRGKRRRTRYGITDVLTVYLAASGRCELCGLPVMPHQASIDHVIPLSRGGKHDRSNWQLAHRTCNELKGSRLAYWPPPG